MTGPVDVLAEEQVVTAVATELREASEAYSAWVHSHIDAQTTWDTWVEAIRSPEYATIIERYETAKRNARLLLIRREAGY